MLDPNLLAQLVGHADKIIHPVVLAVSLDETDASTRMAGLIDDLATVSEMITIEHRNDAERRPSFRIERTGSPIGVEFAGLPLGHEFTSLVLALLQVGGHPPRIDESTAAEIAALPGEHHFETFYSQTCQNCPDVVQALNAASVLNPNITHVAIDGAVFPDEAEGRNVMAVPTVFRNGEHFEQGRVELEQILARLDSGSVERAAAEIDAKAAFDVLVIGGGPAGAAAAIYAARKGIRTGLVCDRFGGQLLDTMGIENFVSSTYTEGPKLASAMEDHVRSYDVDVIMPHKAAKLVPAMVPGGLVEIELDNGATLQTRSVILATGARWRHLGVTGEADYLTRGVAFCPHCDGPMYKGKRLAVVGGGNSGVEAAIDLAGIVEHVTLLEFQSELIADDVLQAKLRSMANVKVLTNAQTTEVVGDGERVTGMIYKDRNTDTAHTLDVAGIFVQIGLLPNTEWLEGTLDMSNRGEIIVDNGGRTSIPGVIAAGDCTTEPYKQIIVASGAGSTAALSAFDHLIRNSLPA